MDLTAIMSNWPWQRGSAEWSGPDAWLLRWKLTGQRMFVLYQSSLSAKNRETTCLQCKKEGTCMLHHLLPHLPPLIYSRRLESYKLCWILSHGFILWVTIWPKCYLWGTGIWLEKASHWDEPGVWVKLQCNTWCIIERVENKELYRKTAKCDGIATV